MDIEKQEASPRYHGKIILFKVYSKWCPPCRLSVLDEALDLHRTGHVCRQM